MWFKADAYYQIFRKMCFLNTTAPRFPPSY